MPAMIAGRCMCGAVAFEVDGELRDVVNCHCHRCRRWTGHYWAATAARTDAMTFASDATLTWFTPAAGVEYGFCHGCGSSLFWRVDKRPDVVSISAGCLDQPSGLRTTTQIWLAEHGDYHTPLPHLIDHERD